MQKKLSEEEIDEIVEAEANNDSAWEEPIPVHRGDMTSLSLPTELVKRAIFLARLHREANVEKWLMHIIRERIELEENAFFAAKRDLQLAIA
jgi:hypothetical protein